jgi:hypothetical protein
LTVEADEAKLPLVEVAVMIERARHTLAALAHVLERALARSFERGAWE